MTGDEYVQVRWADKVVTARVLRRFKNGKVRVEFTPFPNTGGYVRGRPGTPAKVESMTVEAWQIVEATP